MNSHLIYYHFPQTREWMAENLNFSGNADYPNLSRNNACLNDDSTNCLKGGRYYTWSAAMNLDEIWRHGNASSSGLISDQHQGVCPVGWHIPTQDEWYMLGILMKNYASGCPMEGGPGLSGSGWSLVISTQPMYQTATNTAGFNGLFVGYLEQPGGSINEDDSRLLWWSATEETFIDSVYYAEGYEGYFGSSNFSESSEGMFKGKYLPVRCVRNY